MNNALFTLDVLTSAFVSMSMSPSKFNITSMVMQMQRMGLIHFSAPTFALLMTQMLNFDSDANVLSPSLLLLNLH